MNPLQNPRSFIRATHSLFLLLSTLPNYCMRRHEYPGFHSENCTSVKRYYTYIKRERENYCTAHRVCMMYRFRSLKKKTIKIITLFYIMYTLVQSYTPLRRRNRHPSCEEGPREAVSRLKRRGKGNQKDFLHTCVRRKSDNTSRREYVCTVLCAPSSLFEINFVEERRLHHRPAGSIFVDSSLRDKITKMNVHLMRVRDYTTGPHRYCLDQFTVQYIR
jgi:hypothetical protein